MGFFAVQMQMTVLLFSLLVQPLLAEEQSRGSKSNFKGEAGFGGPTSVGEQLREDDELKKPDSKSLEDCYDFGKKFAEACPFSA